MEDLIWTSEASTGLDLHVISTHLLERSKVLRPPTFLRRNNFTLLIAKRTPPVSSGLKTMLKPELGGESMYPCNFKARGYLQIPRHLIWTLGTPFGCPPRSPGRNVRLNSISKSIQYRVHGCTTVEPSIFANHLLDFGCR